MGNDNRIALALQKVTGYSFTRKSGHFEYRDRPGKLGVLKETLDLKNIGWTELEAREGSKNATLVVSYDQAEIALELAEQMGGIHYDGPRGRGRQ